MSIFRKRPEPWIDPAMAPALNAWLRYRTGQVTVLTPTTVFYTDGVAFARVVYHEGHVFAWLMEQELGRRLVRFQWRSDGGYWQSQAQHLTLDERFAWTARLGAPAAGWVRGPAAPPQP